MQGGVVDPNVVVKGIGPERRGKISASKHGANGVTNGVMGALNRAVLVRVSRGSELNGVTGSFEQIKDVVTFTKVATRVKADILIFDLTGGGGLYLESHMLRNSRGGALLTKNSPWSMPV